MELDYSALGKRIREHRLARKWKQENLAELASVEPSNISHIERGATKVSLPTLIRLANALEVSMDELLYDSLIKNGHVSVKMIDDLLKDSSAKELAVVTEVVRHTLELIKKYED